MKNKRLILLFALSGLVWLASITFFFFYEKVGNEIKTFKENEHYVSDLAYYKKEAERLSLEFQTVSVESFSSRSISEFIAKIPKIAELSGIKQMKIENIETRQEKQMEVTDLQMSISSRFSDIANFIDILERSKLPIRIVTLSMVAEGPAVGTTLALRIYKKTIGE